MSADVVPEKLDSVINYKILAIIGVLVIGFHILVNVTEESDRIVYGFSMIIPASDLFLALSLQESILEH